MQHQSIPSTHTTTLEEVQELFQKWRGQKPAHNSHIPDYLWDQVANIVELYRQSDILKHLKINRCQLVSAMKSRQTPQSMDSAHPSSSQEVPDKVTPHPFIKISMPMTLDPESKTCQHHPMTPNPQREQSFPKVELIHPNGVTLRITDMTSHQLSHLMSSFLGMA